MTKENQYLIFFSNWGCLHICESTKDFKIICRNIFLCSYAYDLSMLYTCAHTNEHTLLLSLQSGLKHRSLSRDKKEIIPYSSPTTSQRKQSWKTDVLCGKDAMIATLSQQALKSISTQTFQKAVIYYGWQRIHSLPLQMICG